MNRRGFLIASGVVLAGGAAALLHRREDTPSVAATIARLEQWQGRALVSHTAWTPAQVLHHMAQSVEYSLSGYPLPKPRWFQHTVGRAAFETVSHAGAMHHSLIEAIPGAPAIAADDDTQQGLKRLCMALRQFEAHRGPLAPHFAFGALSHAEFAAAHVLHIENHLQQLVLA